MRKHKGKSISTLDVETVVEQLRTLGVVEGSVLLVHSCYRAICPIEDGPWGVIRALHSALGTNGTLVMPTMTDNDDKIFDTRTTSALSMGVLADSFWRLPGVLRSNNPASFAAAGPYAAEITAPHATLWPDHGPGTPVARVHDLNGWVLLLGVEHTSNTTIHLAERLGGAQYRRSKYTTVLIEGYPKRIDYFEIDHCCSLFTMVDGWMNERRLQLIGPVGHGSARLMRSSDIVTIVTEQIRLNPTIFLHPFGVDDECDEARRSLGEKPNFSV